MTFDAYAYLDAAAAALDLRVPLESRDAVAANLTRLEAIARQVMADDVSTVVTPDSRDGA